MTSDTDLQNLAGELENDVRHLAETIGERNMGTDGTMEETAGWIESRMLQAGYRPRRHSYMLGGVWHGYGGMNADNLVAELPAKPDDKIGFEPEKIIIIGAHYDSVPASPGANDNASAVAVLLSLAHHLIRVRLTKTVRLVAFANEEPPFFLTSDMGSYAYASRCRQRDEHITAMIALDGVGFFSDRPGSQRYPLPGLGWWYPDRAEFIGLVTRLRDKPLLRRTLKAFRKGTDLPVQGAALPAYVPGVYWSDHWSFWKHHYPALLVTDTLPYRDPWYHTPADTADRLDYLSMAGIVQGLEAVVRDLAGE